MEQEREITGRIHEHGFVVSSFRRLNREIKLKQNISDSEAVLDLKDLSRHTNWNRTYTVGESKHNGYLPTDKPDNVKELKVTIYSQVLQKDIEVTYKN